MRLPTFRITVLADAGSMARLEPECPRRVSPAYGPAGCNRPAPGELGQTLSKECGATCCPGCRKTLTLRPSALLNRLKSAHPDRCSDTHLWTLRRRVQQWRGNGHRVVAEPLAGCQRERLKW